MRLLRALRETLGYFIIIFVTNIALGLTLGLVIGLLGDIGIIPNDPITENTYIMVDIVSNIVLIYVFNYFLKEDDTNLVEFCKVKKLSLKNVALISILGITLSFCDVYLANVLVDAFNSVGIDAGYDVVTSRIESLRSGYLGLFLAVIMAPIFEEVLFRGLILNSMKKHVSVVTAIILQALIFGVMHGNIVQGSYAFLGGIIYGIIYLKTGSILSSILLHMVGNFIGAVGISFLSEYVNHSTIISIMYICIVLSVGLFILIMKINSSKEECKVDDARN